MGKNKLNCPNYNEGLCSSCGLINSSYEEQVHLKQTLLVDKLGQLISDITTTHPPMISRLSGFRYKAKMVVSGSVEKIVLGLVNENGDGVDLTQCALYSHLLIKTFEALKPYILKVGLTPYNITKRKGRLKFIIITQTLAHDELMIRFVLNDTTKLDAMRANLPLLFNLLPNLKVVSANLQPIHQAVLEGEEEYILSQETALREEFNGIPLYINPKSFFQTHPLLAEKLYFTASRLALEIQPKYVWDLFCGVGGFGLTVLDQLKKTGIHSHLVGIEIEPNAIKSATQSAQDIGLSDVSFRALDSTLFAKQSSNIQLPDLLIVNPPRRGLGQKLCQIINDSEISHVIYSSCHIDSLKNDLLLMPNLRIDSIQLFDFFPHTLHFEILVKLSRLN